MNRVVFIAILVVQTIVFFVMEHLGYNYAATFIFFSSIVLIYYRRKYLQMKPYWAGDLSDIPKYFKQP